MSRLNVFLAELKRRKVYRASVIYAAAVFGFVQVADAVVPALNLPEWTLTALVFAAIAGFPVAVLVAWLFELTPEGLKRTTGLDPESRGGDGEPLGVPIALLSISLLLVGATGWWLVHTSGGDYAPIATTDADRSIAVLPLGSDGRSEADAFFARGLHEEITARLGKIEDIRVISAASVAAVASPSSSGDEIARALGVRFVLEGTVTRTPDGVSVAVELLDSSTGRRIWRERYRRPGSALAGIQADIALETARILNARLEPAESAIIEAVPTEDAVAMEFLLRGHAYMRSAYDEELTDRRWRLAIAMYDSAVARDGGFALAYAHLAWTHLRYFWFGYDRSDARLEMAKEALDQAMVLDPSLPETRHVLGNYYYWGFRDYTQALFNYEDALRELPNDSELVASIGFVKRRQGRMEEAVAHQVAGFELDPRNAIYARNIAQTYRAMRRFDESVRYSESSIALTTNSSGVQQKAEALIARDGDLEAARATLRAAEGLVAEDPMTNAWFWLHLYAREYDEALGVLDRAPTDVFMEPFEDSRQYQVYPRSYLRGVVLDLQGDAEAAKASFQEALAELEAKGGAESADRRVLKARGQALAALGRRTEALAVGNRLVEILPVSEDALWGPGHLEILARIHARLGDAEEAVAILEALLDSHYYAAITPALLALDPAWDRIRRDPAFARLAESAVAG